MSERPLVLYHAHCSDGFCAAWIAHRRFGEGAEYVPVQYGQAPPDVTGRDVVVLDFSYKRPVLEEMVRVCRTMVLRDHHKTAQADLEPTDAWPTATDFLFDMSKSGAMLAWDYFFPGERAPWLVEYVQDRDLWLWKLPFSKEVSAGLATLPHDFTVWNKLFADTLLGQMTDGSQFFYGGETIIRQGEAVLRYQAQQVTAICSQAREVDIDGHKVLAANSSVLFSEVGEKLAENRPFGAAWFIRKDGKKQWSLRSREGGIDVSQVAARRGGGGHKAAAGYTEDVA